MGHVAAQDVTRHLRTPRPRAMHSVRGSLLRVVERAGCTGTCWGFLSVCPGQGTAEVQLFVRNSEVLRNIWAHVTSGHPRSSTFQLKRLQDWGTLRGAVGKRQKRGELGGLLLRLIAIHSADC